MVFIESAFLGDEKGMRNVTKVLSGKVVGAEIKVPVDDKLIPPFEVVDKTELTTTDAQKIRKLAEAACGGPDQACMEATTARMTQETLVEKSTAANSTANIVRGRRLTVTVVDDKGVRKQMVVPDGQTFELKGVSSSNPRDPPNLIPSLQTIRGNVFEAVGAIILTAIWVFGVLATYTLFSHVYNPYVGGGLAVAAVLLPGSGYAMILVYFIGKSFVDNYTAKG